MLKTKLINPFQETNETDVTVKVKEETLHLHSNILCIYSTVFKETLEKDSVGNSVKEIVLVDKNVKSVIEFFEFFYPERNKKLTDSTNFKDILELCKMYNISWLTKKIEEYIFTLTLLYDNSSSYFRSYSNNIIRLCIAEQYGFDKVYEKIMSFSINQSFDKLMQYPEFKELKAETIFKLSMKRISRFFNSKTMSNAIQKTLEKIDSETKPLQVVNTVEIINNPFLADQTTDVLITVADSKLYLHSNVLCHYSPVFKAMLEGGFKEATTKEIELKNKEAKNVIEIFKFLYADKVPQLSDNTNFQTLLSLSQEYQIEWLTKHLENYLVSLLSGDSKLDRMYLLSLADQYNLEKLRSSILAKDLGFINVLVGYSETFDTFNTATKYQLVKKSILQHKITNHETECNAILTFLDTYFQ